MEEEREVKLDGILKENLDMTKTAIRKDWDFVFAVAGDERTGKSCFTFQIAKYLDPEFNLKQVVFNADDFMAVAKKLKPYQSIVWDEAIEGGSSGEAVTKVGRTIKKFFAQMGQKNLFVFLVIPSFFDLNKPLAIHRTRGLFHVYAKAYDKRGHFGYFSKKRKGRMYVDGKKYYEIPTKYRYNFYGSFREDWVVDKEKYVKMKSSALDKNVKDEPIVKVRWQRDEAIKWLYYDYGVKQKEIVGRIKMAGRSVQRAVKQKTTSTPK